MIALQWNVLSFLDVVDALEDGQAMAHTGDAHALEIVVQQRNQGLSDNVIFCTATFQRSAYAPQEKQTRNHTRIIKLPPITPSIHT